MYYILELLDLQTALMHISLTASMDLIINSVDASSCRTRICPLLRHALPRFAAGGNIEACDCFSTAVDFEPFDILSTDITCNAAFIINKIVNAPVVYSNSWANIMTLDIRVALGYNCLLVHWAFLSAVANSLPRDLQSATVSLVDRYSVLAQD